MIYFAGVPGGGWELSEKRLNKFWNFRLWSYYWILQDKKNMKRKNKKIELFLDSGAFSAKSQGVKIDVQDYISFIKDNENVISVYANLDVIGDAEGTLQNQKIMEKAGLSPIPVYHYGEDEKYLLRYIDGYEYIALGGMVLGSSSRLRSWLDKKFPLTCDKDGMPKVKVHGFGLTSLRLMLQYPWYSVDSTSWVMTGRMGSIFIPNKRRGEWVYDEDSLKVPVSSRSPKLEGVGGKHLETMNRTPNIQALLLDYIGEKGYKLGKSKFIWVKQSHELQENERWVDKKPDDKGVKRELEVIEEDGISNRYQLRDEMNIIYFLDLEKSMPKWPWAFKQQGQKSADL